MANMDNIVDGKESAQPSISRKALDRKVAKESIRLAYLEAELKRNKEERLRKIEIEKKIKQRREERQKQYAQAVKESYGGMYGTKKKKEKQNKKIESIGQPGNIFGGSIFRSYEQEPRYKRKRNKGELANLWGL